MGWAIGFVGGRDVGYGVPATCEYPSCKKKIDRGLSYACGDWPGEHDGFCGLFFCGKHMFGVEVDGEWHQACDVCVYNFELPEDAPYTDFKDNYLMKPDRSVWIRWKLNHSSWKQWRDENPEEVEQMREQLNEKVLV